MKKQTLLRIIQAVCAILFCCGFMIVGAAIDSCDHDTITIGQSLVTVTAGLACTLIGGLVFSIIDRYL